MKILILISMFALAACGSHSGSSDGVTAIVQPTPVPTPVEPTCSLYNSCTMLSNGWGNVHYEYDCVSTTYQISEHPELEQFVQDAGATCIITQEDYNNGVQGPGPLAIPSEGL